MREISTATDTAWRSEVHAGDTRPVVRATVQRIFLDRYNYNTEDAPGGDYDHDRIKYGFYRSVLFGSGGAPREIPNIKKFDWSRSIDQDIATATLTIQNTQLIPIGSVESATHPDDFELPGFLTYNRGEEPEPNARWGYGTTNAFNRKLMPDRLIRTYEGYGSDESVAPGDDENLYISGTWLIDDVVYDATGDIQITMRDVGRLLLDHIVYPPIVPYANYPMEWAKIETVEDPGHRVGTGGTWGKPSASTSSSNQYFVGAGIVDTPTYVRADASVQGHSAAAVLTDDIGDYWLSTGQHDRSGWAWWQENLTNDKAVNGVRIHTFGGPYKIYISIHDGTQWLGRRTIPYQVDPEAGTVGSIDIEADIPFVHTETAQRGTSYDIILKKKYPQAKRIRITFTNLRQMTAVTYPWRAGLQNLELYYAEDPNDLGFGTGTLEVAMGNYRDFTDIVKWVGAHTGWFWPEDPQSNFQRFRDTFDPDEDVHYTFGTPDPCLVYGRVWGHFVNSGTAGVAKLTSDSFDKQPMMNVIAKVREINGFQFWIDECGGMVWRFPNTMEVGNWVGKNHKQGRRNPDRTDEYVTIDEETSLLTYQTRHSSRNLRERIFVGGTNGKVGVVVSGYTPLATSGLRRTAGWLDENWGNKHDCLVAGDLIAARQMFDYRRSRLTIWGNPALQVDDQFRIYERMTNETYFHYCIGISSSIDMQNGTWDYNVESHWLGPDVDEAFIMNPEYLQTPTQNYLLNVGGEA